MPYIDKTSTREIIQNSGVLGPLNELEEPSFSETFGAGVGIVFDEESSISSLLNREGFSNRHNLIKSKINAGLLDEQQYTNRRGEFDYDRAATDLDDPEIKTDNVLHQERSAMLAQRRAYGQDVLNRGSGLAQFLGMGSAMMLDPINIATMPIAVASTSAKALGVVGRSLITARNAAALSAVSEMGIQAFVYQHKLDIESPNAASHAINSIAFAAIGGGVIGGVAGGLAGYFSKVRKAAQINRGDVEPELRELPSQDTAQIDAEILARTVDEPPITLPKKSAQEEELDAALEYLQRMEETLNYGRAQRNTPDELLAEYDKVLQGERDSFSDAADNTIKTLETEIETLKKQGDTIGKMIARAGGIDRDAAIVDGIDEAAFNIKPLFGKPLFRKAGGRVEGKKMDEVAEMLNERGFRGGRLTANDAVAIAHDLSRGVDIQLDADIVGRIDYAENQIARLERETEEAGIESVFKNIREEDIAEDVGYLEMLEARRSQMSDNFDPSYEPILPDDAMYPSKAVNSLQSDVLENTGLKADYDRAMAAYEQLDNPKTVNEAGKIVKASDEIAEIDDQLEALNSVMVCAIG